MRLIASTILCIAVFAETQAAEITVLTTDRSGAPVSDAVVSFTVPGIGHAVASGGAQMRQRNKNFEPKVLAIATGTSVRFPNDDPVLHHVYSFSPAKSFELDLYSNDTEPTVVFDIAGVVAIGCNIHDEMRGYIYVTSDSHFGTSDTNGEIRFELLQAGNYEVHIWHPQIDSVARVPVSVSLMQGSSERLVVALDLNVDHAGQIDAYERGGYE